MSILGIIAFIVLLSVIIVVHELGHMLVAKHFGVYCHEFSLGMGPVLYQKKGKETTYSCYPFWRLCVNGRRRRRITR